VVVVALAVVVGFGFATVTVVAVFGAAVGVGVFALATVVGLGAVVAGFRFTVVVERAVLRVVGTGSAVVAADSGEALSGGALTFADVVAEAEVGGLVGAAMVRCARRGGRTVQHADRSAPAAGTRSPTPPAPW
jgi:hypothetical protein